MEQVKKKSIEKRIVENNVEKKTTKLFNQLIVKEDFFIFFLMKQHNCVYRAKKSIFMKSESLLLEYQAYSFSNPLNFIYIFIMLNVFLHLSLKDWNSPILIMM